MRRKTFITGYGDVKAGAVEFLTLAVQDSGVGFDPNPGDVAEEPEQPGPRRRPAPIRITSLHDHAPQRDQQDGMERRHGQAVSLGSHGPRRRCRRRSVGRNVPAARTWPPVPHRVWLIRQTRGDPDPRIVQAGRR
jgi:hypothetical protein